MIFTLSDKHYFVSSIYVQSGTHTYINSLGPIYSRYAQEIHEPIQQKWTGNGAKKDSMHPIFQKKKAMWINISLKNIAFQSPTKKFLEFSSFWYCPKAIVNPISKILSSTRLNILSLKPQALRLICQLKTNDLLKGIHKLRWQQVHEMSMLLDQYHKFY